jgi:hypothetical protein
MRRVILIILALFLMVFLLEAGDFEKLTFKKSETIEKDLAFKGGAQPRTFEIDNVFGFIHLQGYSGKTVKLTAKKTIKAKSEEKIQQAQKEVKMDISTEGNSIRVFVDGPFRDEKGHINWNIKKAGYIVQYDFELKVPHKTALSLSTINKGDILVSDIEGDFEVRNVNGGIRMKEVIGSGNAHTVNGKVLVDFVKNPVSDCSFHTINGKVAIVFRPGLSADFQLKTFNGKMYSDFPAAYLPAKPGKGGRKDGKYVYKSNRFQGIRIGKGGPAIKMDTLNGNIYITKGE